ncbi:MAG: hypothetical protein Q8J89_15210 [Caulobacter sp.]|nr:hypothetical protein [Caulobacter sp.]
MKKRSSDVLLIVYVGVLLVLLLWAFSLTQTMLSPTTNVASVLPPKVLLAISYSLPALVVVRIIMHLRARRMASRLSAGSEPESEND